MRRQPVLLIVENSVSVTGAFRAALGEASLLSPAYRPVFVISGRSTIATHLKEAGFSYYTLPLREISWSPVNLLLYVPTLIINSYRLRKIVRKEQASVLQVNDFYNLLGFMLRMFGYRGKLITYVRFLPSAVPWLLRWIWTGAAQRWSYRVVAVSDAVLRQLPTKSNTVRIYDPIDLPEKYELRSAEGTGEVVSFLYLANYTRGKGQELAIRAFEQAFRQSQQIRLSFYGGDMGLKKNRAFRAELNDMAETRGLSRVIKFYDFALDTEAIIKGHDVLLNFSKAESFSMTCAESSFYGRPVIATCCGGPEEIIADRLTGILVPVGDIESMADAMLALAADPAQRRSMGEAGRLRVREKYRADIYRKEIESILR